MSLCSEPHPQLRPSRFIPVFVMLLAALGMIGCYDMRNVNIESLASSDAAVDSAADDDDMDTEREDAGVDDDDDDMDEGDAGGAGGDNGDCGSCDPAPMISGLDATECCTDEGKCGLNLGFGGCMERDQPGMASEDCPDQSLMGFPLSGCCRPDGTCGIMDSFLGLGCTDAFTQFGGGTTETCDYMGD